MLSADVYPSAVYNLNDFIHSRNYSQSSSGSMHINTNTTLLSPLVITLYPPHTNLHSPPFEMKKRPK